MKNTSLSLYLGLVHYPIKNKNGQVVTTSVTNLDVHDISRSCRTFGIKKYFIVTPLEVQQKLIQRILQHWNKEESSAYNPDRSEAFSLTELSNSVEDVISHIETVEKKKPFVVVTGANFKQSNGSVETLKKELERINQPCLLLFGTGWGLHDSLVESSDFLLEPIYSKSFDSYNHLSVRSAVAIYLHSLTL